MSRNNVISKWAKLTGIKRFFKDIPQNERASVSDEHNRQPSSFSNLSLIPEQPVVYPTLESSTAEIAGSSQSCVPCVVILSLAENDEQDLQFNFHSNDSCRQQSISGSRSSSIAVCVDETPQHLDSDDPDPLNSLHLDPVIYMVQVVRYQFRVCLMQTTSPVWVSQINQIYRSSLFSYYHHDHFISRETGIKNISGYITVRV
ncbi:hypothetical protein LOD99_15446 [Oopsacas minuta]|uniref:Uncharacterized protein n=1 Tax=Oopsacas minuta TaxID=111878 RepID=A0AAV7K9V9_9METZ|nr:hypothetical protein LOD99_15446 [Oopsacas minuta]